MSDWIDREYEEPKPLVTVKCAVCDRYTMTIEEARPKGPICLKCQERVRREKSVPIYGPDFCVAYKEVE